MKCKMPLTIDHHSERGRPSRSGIKVEALGKLTSLWAGGGAAAGTAALRFSRINR